MHLAWPEDGTALALEMLPQPLACARSRPGRGPQLEGRGPSDSELRLASLSPQVSSRPSIIAGSFPPAGTSLSHRHETALFKHCNARSRRVADGPRID